MKMSNFLLSVVAMFALGVAVNASTLVIPKQPTSVTYIPAKDDGNTRGGGMAIELPANPTSRQARVLTLAYQIAERDGHRYPQLLQGILLQETLAGGLDSYNVAGGEYGLATNKRYYGLGQIKLSAAKDVLAAYPVLWTEFEFHGRTDEEIIAKLIENEAFNISVASKYLLILRQYGYSTPHELAKAYNMGPGGARHAGATTHYSEGVMRHIQSVPARLKKGATES
jgi:hypothetical protein